MISPKYLAEDKMAVATHAKRHVCRRKFLTSEITDECYFKKLSFMECSRSCCFTAKLCSSRRRKTTKTFVHSCSSTSSSKNNSRDDSTSLTSDFEGSSVTSPLPQMVLCTDCSNGWKRIQRASRHFQLQKIILTWSQQLLCTPSSSLLRLFSLLSLLVLLQSTQFTVCSAQKLIYKSHSSSVNTNPATSNVVIPHIKYGQGLNKWSFLSVDRDNRKCFLFSKFHVHWKINSYANSSQVYMLFLLTQTDFTVTSCVQIQ